MTSIHAKYLGQLRCSLTHLESGTTIITDAPKDNQGLGTSFSPTDLLCASLAACMQTIMGIAARTHEFNIDGLEADITKIMQSSPRKVSEIIIRFYNFPEQLSEKQQKIVEQAALSCPVALSIDRDISTRVSFEF